MSLSSGPLALEASGSARDGAEEVRARLLKAIILALMTVGTASATMQVLVVPGFFPTFCTIAGAVIALAVAYVSTARGALHVGSVIVVATTTAACFMGAALNPADALATPFLVVGVLIATIVLRERAVLALVTLDALGIAALVHWQRLSPSLGLAAASLVAISGALAVVWSRHHRALEANRVAALAEHEALPRTPAGRGGHGDRKRGP